MRSLGKKVAIGFLSLAAALVLTSFAYKDSTLGFKIDYPDSWELGTSNSKDMVVAQTKQEGTESSFRENMNIIVAPIEGNISLENLYDLNYENAQKMLQDFTPVEVEKVKIGGEDAIKLVYTFRYETTTLKNVVYMLIHNKKMYALTFATVVPHYDQFAPVFDKIAQTITFLDEPTKVGSPAGTTPATGVAPAVESKVVAPASEQQAAPASGTPAAAPVSEPAVAPAPALGTPAGK